MISEGVHVAFHRIRPFNAMKLTAKRGERVRRKPEKCGRGQERDSERQQKSLFFSQSHSLSIRARLVKAQCSAALP